MGVMEWLAWALLASCAAVVWAYVALPYWTLRRLRRQGVLGPPFRPFFGNFRELIEYEKPQYKTAPGASALPYFDHLCKEYGPVSAYMLGSRVRLLVADPALIRQAYVANNEKYHKTDMAKSLTLFQGGLLLEDGPSWAAQRRHLNPAFNPKEIKRMMATMVNCIMTALDCWDAKISESGGSVEVEVHKELSLLTLNIIGRTAFGATDADKGPAEQIYETLLGYFVKKVKSLRLGVLIPFYTYLPTKLNRQLWATDKRVKELMLALIQKRRITRKEKPISPSTESCVDLLELMLSTTSDNPCEGVSLDEHQLIGHCLTFLMAGHETVANLLTWTMLLLAQHPSWQEKGRAEVDDIIGFANLPSFDQVPQLKTLTNILYESLRLFTPTPLVNRKCVKENHLGKFEIPLGIDIIIPMSIIHRRKELWGEDAAEFNPDRFRNGLSSACSHPTAFIPFSVGPRTCIGQNFAMLEARLTLAQILQRYSWRLAPGYKHWPSFEISLKPKFGVPLILEHRSRQQK